MMNLNKRNYKKLSRGRLLPTCERAESMHNVIQRNQELLNRCKDMYMALHPLREQRRRNVNYVFGRQLDDKIQDPDGCGWITEKQYILRQGNIPLIANVLRKIVKAVVGVYVNNKQEPFVIARDRDEQKLGEMMTVAMQYNYQRMQMQLRNARMYEEGVISAVLGWRVDFGFDRLRKIDDLKITDIDINMVFFDNNIHGLYMENVETIGYLHDMTLDGVLELCGDITDEEEEAICNLYANTKHYTTDISYQFDGDNRKDNQFYHPTDRNKCRVIEVWTLESERCIRCHDTLKGEYVFYPKSERKKLEAENARRIDEMVSLGGRAEDAALIDMQYVTRRFWVGRYMTPQGYILAERESPFEHGSHPIVIGAYPLVDGEIHSIVEDGIPTQRSINRLLQRIEFIRMASAKGVLIVPEQLLEGKKLEDIATQWSKANGVIALKFKEGIPMPQQLSTSPNTAGDMDMLRMQMSILDDISGIHGALRGEAPRSGTPSSLYAQEAQNASNNIADFQEWYVGLVQKRDYMAMQVIQQYYTDARYMNIAGKNYAEESKWYNPEKVRNSHFDLSMSESTSNISARTLNETILMELLKMGAISPELYLESSSTSFTDKLLERMKQVKSQMDTMQVQGQQVNPLVEQALQQ